MLIFSLAELMLISHFWKYLDNGIHCLLRFIFSLLNLQREFRKWKKGVSCGGRQEGSGGKKLILMLYPQSWTIGIGSVTSDMSGAGRLTDTCLARGLRQRCAGGGGREGLPRNWMRGPGETSPPLLGGRSLRLHGTCGHYGRCWSRSKEGSKWIKLRGNS